MSIRASERIQWALIAAMTLAGLVVIAVLPPDARVPTHFDLHGNADGWSAAPFALLLMPVLAALNAGLQRLLPKIDPRGANLTRSAGAVATIFTAVTVLLAVVQGVIVAAALGLPWRAAGMPQLMVGGLFVVIGNVLGKLRTNYTVGIRTPWTLANERVWDHTHRFGGKVFVAGGLLLCALPMLPLDAKWQEVGLVVLPLLCAAAPVLKSWLLWRDLQRPAH